MATVSFNSTITKVDSANVTLDNSTYIGIAVKLTHNDHFINTKTSQDYTIPDTYNYAGLIYTGTKHLALSSTTAFGSATFPDGVYRATVSESYDDGNTYTSTAYQLLMYDTDARWALFQLNYDPTNAANLAIFNNVTQAYADITTLSSDYATNYAAINTKITYINTQLNSAVFYFTSTSTLTSAGVITASTSFYNGGVLTDTADFTIENLTITQQKVYNATPQLNIEVTGLKTKTFSAGSPIGSPNYTDGVLENTLFYNEDGGTWEWVSVTHVLVTTQIDADIAAYPTDSLFNISNKALMVYFRGLVDTAFAAEDYTLTSTYIQVIQNLLFVIPNPFVTSLLLTDTDNFSSFSSTLSTTGLIFQYNLLWNTLTQNVEDAIVISNDYLLPDGNGSANITSQDTFAVAMYADGVYQLYNYLSDITGGTLESTSNSNSGWNVVTTTITNQFAIFEANYDPNNTAQAASYQTMLTAFAQIATLSSSIGSNYAAINTQIQLIQGELALFVDLGLTLELTSSNTLKTTITSTIPNVIYSDQSFVLTNLETLVEYSTNDFPANYVDTIKNVTSTTFNNSTTYADSVYQVEVSWTSANDMEFAGNAYALVTTAIDCGIAKYGANNVIRKCNSASLKKATELLMYRKFITLEFAQGNYEMCIEYIKRIQTMLADCGCNC